MTTAHNTTPQYPFTAVVGMDDLRLALLLNAVSPRWAVYWSAGRRAPPRAPPYGRCRR